MKRFLFLFAAVIGFWSIADAQTIVSTEPSNRNVVLEEYTGIHCGYCPDGHKIALELKEANPGRVFPINIHTGSFASPNAGEIDLRTRGGDTLASPSGLTGYPAGSVNRSTNPWANSRNQWKSIANNILSQVSPVNIAAETSFNPATNELTVNVEYYYTADQAKSTNYLTVLITQSEILGTQSGASNYNPDYVNEDGLYRHQHALRMPVTSSVWGEPITQTTEGTFGQREFTVNVPLVIGNVAMDPANFEIVAFISETQSNIITGTSSEFDIPDEQKISMAVESTPVSPDILAESFSPKATVTNNSDVAIEGFDLQLIVGDETVTKNFDLTIQPGASAEVEFDPFDLTSTKGYVTYVVAGFKNVVCSAKPNGAYDWTFSDNISTGNFLSLAHSAFTEGKFTFEPDGMQDYLIMANENQTIQYFSTPQQVNGAENTNSAIVMILKKATGFAGKSGYVIFGEADFTQSTEVNLSYYYAYADGKVGGTAPVIKAQYSEDGGETWITTDEHTAIETNTDSFGDGYYYPNSSEYRLNTLSLSGVEGKKVLVRVAIQAGTDGNLIWFDQAEFVGPTGTIFVAEKKLDFGEVTEGSYAEQEITIENKSDVDLSISSIAIKDDPSNVFVLVDTPSELTLAGGATQAIKVKFRPINIDFYTAELIINSNDAENPEIKVTLLGEGTGESVEEEFIANSALKLMPNPVATTATLNYFYSGVAAVNVDYSLADITGKTVAKLGKATLLSGMNTMEFDVSELPAGKYFLVITADNSTIQQVPVMVEK